MFHLDLEMRNRRILCIFIMYHVTTHFGGVRSVLFVFALRTAIACTVRFSAPRGAPRPLTCDSGTGKLGAHGLRPPGGCPRGQPAGASLAEFLRRLLRRDSAAARLGSLRASGSGNPQRRLSAGIPRPDRSASSLPVLFTGWGSEACSLPLLPCSSVTSRSGVSQ